MIWKIVREERRSLRARIYLFKKSKFPYSSTNYMFITNLEGTKMRHRNYKDTVKQSIPQVNNNKPIKKKSTL